MEGWRVGENCGPWVSHPDAPLSQQSQVLFGNVFAAIERVNSFAPQVLKAFYRTLCPGKKLMRSYLLDTVRTLTALPRRLVQNTWQKLSQNGWLPAVPVICTPVQLCTKRRQEEVEDLGKRVLNILVTEALANAYQGHSDWAYQRGLARLAKYGVNVGEKYHTREFVRLVEQLGMQCVRTCTVEGMKVPLHGLGIPSDFSCVFDGVSPGATEYPRTETLLPIGLRYSHPRRGCLLSRMVAVPSQGGGKSGVETKEVVLNALANAPGGGFTRRRLRASLAAAGGDGAVVSGGTDARHKSTKAADHVFAAVHPSMEEPLAFWDLFHRNEVGAMWAVRDSPYAVEVFDVSRVMLQLFGVGSGRVLHRSVAELMSESVVRPSEGGGTRPFTYGYRVCESLVRNFRTYHLSLEARIAQTHGFTDSGMKKGAQSLRKLIDVGRRLSSLDFVAFLIMYRDLCQLSLLPFSMLVQDNQPEAVTVVKQAKQLCQSLVADHSLLVQMYVPLLNIAALVSPLLDMKSMRTFWFAFRCSKLGHRFPTLLSHTCDLVFEQRFRGCELQIEITQVPGHSQIHKYLLCASGSLIAPIRPLVLTICACEAIGVMPHHLCQSGHVCVSS